MALISQAARPGSKDGGPARKRSPQRPVCLAVPSQFACDIARVSRRDAEQWRQGRGEGDAVIQRRSDWRLTAPAAVGLGTFYCAAVISGQGPWLLLGEHTLAAHGSGGAAHGKLGFFLAFPWELLTAASAAAGFLTAHGMGSSRCRGQYDWTEQHSIHFARRNRRREVPKRQFDSPPPAPSLRSSKVLLVRVLRARAVPTLGLPRRNPPKRGH
jgi:hypothetical protein